MAFHRIIADDRGWEIWDDVVLFGTVVLVGTSPSGATAGTSSTTYAIVSTASVLFGAGVVALRRYTDVWSIETHSEAFWRSFALFAWFGFVLPFVFYVAAELPPAAQRELAAASLLLGVSLGVLHYRYRVRS